MTAVESPVETRRAPDAPPPPAPPRTSVRLDRIVVGLLLAAAGLGWLLDEAGVSVAWRMLPAAALIVVGVALLGSIAGGRGRAGLIGLGAVLLVVAASVGVGVDRFAGPAGDRLVTPAADTWPVTVRHSAGNVTVDLSRTPLPAAGRMDIEVGAGRIVLVVPKATPVRIDATVVTGNIRIDDVSAGEGLDVRWSEPDAADAAIEVTLHVGVGEIEVNHE
jgi:hypothetical protein